MHPQNFIIIIITQVENMMCFLDAKSSQLSGYMIVYFLLDQHGVAKSSLHVVLKIFRKIYNRKN